MIRHVVLALIVLAYAGTAYLSPLEWNARSVPEIAHVADLPPQTDQAKFGEFLRYTGIAVTRAAKAPVTSESPVELGYSFRQISVMRLPLIGYRELGLALYQEQADGYRMVPLNDDYIAELEKEPGARLDTNYIFPWWKYAWGWLFAVALIGWYLLQRRAERAAREASGII
ncbi:hypothetical protein ACVWZA_003843 [Sphingomonas sp. UYAg733]